MDGSTHPMAALERRTSPRGSMRDGFRGAPERAWSSLRSGGRWPTFLLCWAATFAFAVHVGSVVQWYDSSEYASPASFYGYGHLDFALWDTPLRGYFLGLLNTSVIHWAGALGIGAATSIRFLTTVPFALLGSIVLPDVVGRSFGARPGLLQRIASMALLAFFWRGYSLYTLTDIPSLVLLLGAVLLVLLLEDAGPARTRWLALAAGAAASAAANVRPVYEIALPVVLVMAIVLAYRSRLHAFIAPFWVAVGIVLVAAPQTWLNVVHHRNPNPLHFETAEGVPLFLITLGNGLHFSKYTTNVADPDFAIGGVFASDEPAGALYIQLVTCCPPTQPGGFTYGAYLRMLRQHPGTMSKVYAQHAFNGFDHWYTTPYLDRVLPVSRTQRAVDYTAWFAAALAVLGAVRRLGWRGVRGRWRGVALLLVVFLPLGVALPGSVEERYYLPAHLLVYGVIAFLVLPALGKVQWRRLRPTSVARMLRRPGPLATVFAYGVWMTCCFAQSQAVIDKIVPTS